MLIATAGHIDHGKTSLVRAITGAETDRLPEERKRGISIDLGFAYWQPTPGTIVGFVDVPGHERFVRNMLAGVSAVDFALLVVAADDGIMPQTREHLEIIDLFAITRGAVVITKRDKADADQIATVERDVRALLTETALAGAPVLAVSSLTGEGIAELAELLAAAASEPFGRHHVGDLFRMAIDRTFSVAGLGTVVTGAVADGSVAPGDRLLLQPAGIPVRVRGIQSAGIAVDRADADQRCAINLVGADVSDAHRGDWLRALPMTATTQRIDAHIKVAALLDAPLRHNSQLHVHLGTADIIARILLPRQKAAAPGQETSARLVLETPASCASGDRLVLRDASAQHTLGGGHVIDPFAPAARTREADRAAVIAAMDQRDPAAALAALLAVPLHVVDLDHFQQAFNLSAPCLETLVEASGGVVIGAARGHLITRAQLDEAIAACVDILERFHVEQPGAIGPAPRDLRRRLGRGYSPAIFEGLLQRALSTQRLDLASGKVKLPGHSPSFTAAETAMWQQLLPWLESRGMQPFTIDNIRQELRTTDAPARALLYRRHQAGQIWKITERRYMLHSQVLGLAAAVVRLGRSRGDGFTAAQYRDATGMGRSLAIEVLEFFDRIGVTLRRGDLRTVRADPAGALGEPPDQALRQ